MVKLIYNYKDRFWKKLVISWTDLQSRQLLGKMGLDEIVGYHRYTCTQD